jgi:opacity protein-like surface antigen
MNKFILMCVVFLSSLTVQASDLSLFAGWTGVGSLGTVVGQVDLSDFNVFGVRYEKDFFVVLGFENTLSFSSGSVLAAEGENNGGLNYNGNLVLNLPVRRTLPYFTLGMGVLHRFGTSFPDVGSRFTFNFGGGLKLRGLAGPMGVRIDYRRVTVYGVLDENAKTHEISGGVMFTW